MAIQDQCNRCRKNGSSECTSNKIFDGNSCELYVKKGIDLEKHEIEEVANSIVDNNEQVVEPIVDENDVITSEYLKENTEVHGWLTFFLFSMVLGGFISFIYAVFTFDVADYGGSYLLPISDVLSGGMLFALSIYTLIAFQKRKPDAVFLAKTYVVFIFAFSLLGLFGGDFESNGMGSLKQLMRSLIWSIIWFLYLCNSSQVEEVIPSDFRKKNAIDYYIIGAMILLPLGALGGGIAEIALQQNRTEAAFISQAQLGEDEYTDGRIIFTKPMGFSCKKEEVGEQKLTMFYLEGYDNSGITICSDYDSDMSFQNFKSYRDNWEDESVEDIYHTDDAAITNTTTAGDKYWIQSRKYENEEVSFCWVYAMLFSQKTGKVAVISYYHPSSSDTVLDNLLESVKFE